MSHRRRENSTEDVTKAVVSSVCFGLSGVIRRRAQRAADSEDNKVKQGARQTRRPLPEERFINYANLQPSERPERNREFEVATDRASVPLSSHRGATPRKETATKALKAFDCFRVFALDEPLLFVYFLIRDWRFGQQVKKKERREERAADDTR